MNRVTALIVIFTVVALALVSAGAAAQEGSGEIEVGIVGVPEGVRAGGFDLKTEIFTADVSQIEGAYVQIKYEGIIVIGQIVEFRRKDNYLVVTGNVQVEQDDLFLTGDKVEYYPEQEKMIGTGNLKVTTKDAVVWADQMVFLRNEDKVDFLQNVIVEVTDAEMFGEHFVMLRAEEQMEFIGPFRGEFRRNQAE
jgi:hypothetical protein